MVFADGTGLEERKGDVAGAEISGDFCQTDTLENEDLKHYPII